jgi:hypothetical protein
VDEVVVVKTWKVNPVIMGVAGFILAVAPFSKAQTDMSALFGLSYPSISSQSSSSGNTNCALCESMTNRSFFYTPGSMVNPLASNTASALSALGMPVVSQPAQSASSWTPGQALPGITDLSKVVDPTFKTSCKTSKTYPIFVFCGALAAQAEELAPVWFQEETGKKPDQPIEFEDSTIGGSS